MDAWILKSGSGADDKVVALGLYGLGAEPFSLALCQLTLCDEEQCLS